VLRDGKWTAVKVYLYQVNFKRFSRNVWPFLSHIPSSSIPASCFAATQYGQELFLEWGRYTIEVEGPTILSFQQNITLPRDACKLQREEASSLLLKSHIWF
jgi:hypothetical protein